MPLRRGIEEGGEPPLAEAERKDQEEDRLYGKDKRGDELPRELAFRESRLRKIREAKAALEEEAPPPSRGRSPSRQEERQEERKKKEAARGREVRRPSAPDPRPGRYPQPNKQKNFTDPESCLMKDGAYSGLHPSL